MKKAILILAASFFFAACGGSADQATQDSAKVDSAVVADTTAVSSDSAKTEVIEQPKEVK